jgi:PAS domain S-box-containing protein
VATVASTTISKFQHQADHCHYLQFYQADEQVLTINVGDYLHAGLQRGEGVLVIATPDHQRHFARQLRSLGIDVESAIEARRLLFLDAEEMLDRLIVDGELDWTCFERHIGAAIRQVEPTGEQLGRRAYGEMVGVLWKAENFAAAALLEDFWNRLLGAGGFKLFCAYPIDVFGAEFHTPPVADVLRAHTHLISAGENGAVQNALNRAADEILRPAHDFYKAHESLNTASDRANSLVVPEGEAKILWMRSNFPGRAEEVLARAGQHYRGEKRFRALVENSSDAIALTDPQGRILYASRSTARVVGYKPEEVTGRNAVDFVHAEDRSRLRRTMVEVLGKPRIPVRIEMRVRRKGGASGWIESTISNLLAEPDICAIVSNYRDITERKAAEKELQQANAGLEQFAFAAAHDLQEPLRNVALYAQLLTKQCRDKLDPEAQGFLDVTVEGARRMQALVQDLLAFSRPLDSSVSKTGGEITECRYALAEVLLNLKTSIGATGAEVTHDALPALKIHRAHLVQLLQNLVGNALKYRSGEPPRVHISAIQRRDHWFIGVADNGIGVPPEHRERIFGVFKRLHGREVPGNGIGLAICARIVAHYRGRIQVQPRPDGGSIFSFTLPR